MTIPVGVAVNVVNPGGALHDDSETESTDHGGVVVVQCHASRIHTATP